MKKFNLLKELVGETDRTVAENLPSDKAGYNRAKKLLEDKYGDTNEIVTAYMHETNRSAPYNSYCGCQ